MKKNPGTFVSPEGQILSNLNVSNDELKNEVRLMAINAIKICNEQCLRYSNSSVIDKVLQETKANLSQIVQMHLLLEPMYKESWFVKLKKLFRP